MSLTGDELKKQLPAIARKVLAELPVAGGFFKALEILAGIDEDVLQKRWQVSIEQKLNDLFEDIRQLQSTTTLIPKSVDSLSDEQLHLIRQVQQLILSSHSREKRKATARILCYSTLLECDIGFDMASQFLKDLAQLEEHHLLVLRHINLQSHKTVGMRKRPLQLQSFLSSDALYEKITSDLSRLGFISISDGSWAGSTPQATDYLDVFVKYLLQDIQP